MAGMIEVNPRTKGGDSCSDGIHLVQWCFEQVVHHKANDGTECHTGWQLVLRGNRHGESEQVCRGYDLKINVRDQCFLTFLGL